MPRGQAIAPDITPPARLRRWTAALFGVMALAHQESGYHSYSTFSTAFKQRMHKSVSAWMREEVLK